MRKNTTKLVLLSSFMLLANSPAFSEDILQVYSDAVTGSLRFKSASVDYQIAEARKKEIMAEYDTQLNLQVTPSHTFSGNSDTRIHNGRVINSDSNEVEIDYSLGLSKPLYNQQLNARISQADSMLQQEEVLLDIEKQGLIARVAENYFEFLMAQNKLNYNLSEKSSIAQNLNQLRILYRAKRSTITDLKETESRLDQAEFNISIARNDLDRARKNLRIITGKTYHNLYAPDTASQAVQLVPEKLDDWLRLAMNNSFEITVANRELDIQQKDIELQRAGKSTSIDLFARYEGSSAIGGSSSSDRDGKVGFEVNIPIFTGNRVSSRVLGANYKYKKSQYDLELVKRETTQNVRFSYLTVLSDIGNISTLQRAVNSSEMTLQSMQQGKLVGTRTMTDVLISLRESFQVKRQYKDARYKYLLDIIKLKQAAGILSTEDLQIVNQLLKDPAPVNYLQNKLPPLARTASIRSSEKMLSLEDAWETN